MKFSANPFFSTFASLVCATLLAGCGGGGGDDNGSSMDKYTRTWVGPCVVVNNKLSMQQHLKFMREYGSTADTNGRKYATLFPNKTCSGEPNSVTGSEMEVKKAGTRPTPSGEADMVMLSFSNSEGEPAPAAYGELLLLKDGRLYVGNKRNIGPDGYPNDIDSSYSFSPQ